MKLKSADVIHSFWVPVLTGKTDLIPGQTNVTWMEAKEPGVYRGQCTEYCGAQHAHMALTVVASDANDFKAWRQSQLEGGLRRKPSNPRSKRRVRLHPEMRRVPHRSRHRRRQGIVGPDLSHLMQRRTIAGGNLA